MYRPKNIYLSSLGTAKDSLIAGEKKRTIKTMTEK